MPKPGTFCGVTAEPGSSVPHETNRGVALHGDYVLWAAGEAVLVALDARSGDVVWETTVADNSAGYYITLAPWSGETVMVGASGGEFGIRGFVAAYPGSGSELWRTFRLGRPAARPGPMATSGVGAEQSGSREITRKPTSFWGTGNGGPWMGDQRPGDNLYVSSTVAFDVATQGALPIPPQRFLGLGRSVAADSGGL